MGLYIETPHNLHKALQIKELSSEVKLLDGPPESLDELEPGHYLVCVVENIFFDAAGVAYNEQERQAFLPTPHDRRRRTWLSVPEKIVMDHAPQAEIYLKERA